MAVTYVPIASTTLSSNNTTVNFSSIPQTYKDLVLHISVRSNYSAADMRFRINGNTGSIYSRTYMLANEATTSSTRYTGTAGNNVMSGNFNNTSTTSNIFTPIEIYIPSYTSNVEKPSSTFGTCSNNGSTLQYIYTEANLAQDTNPITSITLIDTFSTGFLAGSSFYLYGINNV